MWRCTLWAVRRMINLNWYSREFFFIARCTAYFHFQELSTINWCSSICKTILFRLYEALFFQADFMYRKQQWCRLVASKVRMFEKELIRKAHHWGRISIVAMEDFDPIRRDIRGRLSCVLYLEIHSLLNWRKWKNGSHHLYLSQTQRSKEVLQTQSQCLNTV